MDHPPIPFEKMRLANLAVVVLAGTLSSLPLRSEEEPARLEIESLGFDLPQAIQVRVQMAALQRPELIEGNKRSGLEGHGDDFIDYRASPADWARVYRASDGLIFLADDLHMALWVREKAGWKCVVPHVRVDKTFGGAFPSLPVRYLGSGCFAVSETVPGDVAEKSKDGFPQARAVTFLIDSKDCKVRERSESFIYDHNPTVVVPKEWASRYKIKSEPKRGSS